MGITCRIVRDSNGNIDYIESNDGQKSILFDNLRSLYGTEKALEYYALTESENFKDVQEVKKEDFTFSGQETLNKLKETGLADNVYQMTSEEIEAKLIELGVEADVSRQVSQPGGYYSNANEAFSNLKDKNVKNIQGWMKALTDVQKNGGIKNVNQELEWIGLEDYLNEYVKENNPKAGNIPSSVVEDYIKSNQIEIVDVSKGDNNYEKRKQREFLEQQQSIALEEEDYEAADYYERQIERLEDTADTSNLQTKYSGYQLKGAENYREVLLTMPPKKVLKSKSGFYSPEYLKEQEDLMQELKSKGYTVNKEGEVFDLEGNNIPYGENKIPDDIEEFIDNINYEAYYTDKEFYETTEEGYRSSHWSEENILAHVRLNEKTLPDGRRVLIINEIQADISQDLKKEQDKILDRVDKEFDNFLDNLIMNKVIIEKC